MVTTPPDVPPGTPPGAPQPGAAEPPRPTGWRRWSGRLLFASVCFNVFLVGLMIGDHVPLRHRPHWLGGPPHAGMFGHDRMGPGRQDPEAGPPWRRGAPGREGGPGEARSSFRQAIESLPAADRQVFEETMKAARADIVRSHRALREARQRANEAIRAEPFDKAAMLAALAEVRERQEAIQLRLHTGTADAVAKLSPEARRQFAEHLAARFAR